MPGQQNVRDGNGREGKAKRKKKQGVAKEKNALFQLNLLLFSSIGRLDSCGMVARSFGSSIDYDPRSTDRILDLSSDAWMGEVGSGSPLLAPHRSP